MKLLASLAIGTATFVAASFGMAAPAMAHGDDDVSIGLRLGPLCVGLCIDGGSDGGGRRHHHSDRSSEDCYEYDCDGTGFYSYSEDYGHHRRYDRKDSYDEYREDSDDSYRRHSHHHRHHDSDDD